MKGIDIRQSGGTLLVTAGIDDSGGLALASGTAALRILEYQTDGTVKQLDFTGNTFKASGLTTPTLAMAALPSIDALTTGLWGVLLDSNRTGGMTVGNRYIQLVTHSALTGVVLRREWQYGSAEGDDSAQTGDSYPSIAATIGAFAQGVVSGSPASNSFIVDFTAGGFLPIAANLVTLRLVFTTGAQRPGGQAILTAASAGGNLITLGFATGFAGAPVAGDKVDIYP